MAILEDFRKRKEAAKQAEQEHATPPARGFALSEILQDKKNSGLFFKMLDSEGGYENLARRLGEKSLASYDIDRLEEARKKFEDKIHKSEAIEKLLTEETISSVARNNPDFAKVVNILGPKKAIGLIQGQLREICVTDESRFDDIAIPIKDHDKYQKGEYKKVNDDVEKLCKEKGIAPGEYLDALEIEDIDDRKKALRKLLNKQSGKFATSMKFIFRITKGNVEELLEGGEELENAIANLEEHRQNIGAALAASVHNYDDMRSALATQLLGEQLSRPEPPPGFVETKKAEADFSDKAFEKDWQDLRKQYSNFDSLSAADQDYIRDAFIVEQQEKYEQKTSQRQGFLYTLIAAMFSKKIEQKRNLLK